MTDLPVIIPGRNEIFMRQTVENVLANIRGNTEIIAVCDGYWPSPPIEDHPKVNIIHFSEPVGQRAATNAGAKLSSARYIMKLDAHCAVDEGFDVKLMKDCRPDWTVVPSMYNLHAFDWVCQACGKRVYQGVQPEQCEGCRETCLEMDIVWKPRMRRYTVAWRFDQELRFQYWKAYAKRPEVKEQGQIIETMSFLGACMFLERDRFWKLGGMDEGHGSWGQFGTEWACKSWLSGGKLMTNCKTWFAHMFRTGNFSKDGESSFPYPLTDESIDHARNYSKELWLHDKWPMAKHPLSWLVARFAPVDGWDESSTPRDGKAHGTACLE